MTPLVLVHGFMGGSEQWGLQASLAGDRDLVALDLPGFGKNSAAEPIDRIKSFAVWALQELSRRGIERFDLLGHSMGGMIVQEMVHLASERVQKLVLYATGSEGELPGRFETIQTSMDRARDEGPEATARRISATWFLGRETADAYEACAAIATQARLDTILAGLAAMQGWTGRERLHLIHHDTLILWGDQDRTYDWPQIETLWKLMPTTSLAVVPGCAHAVHLERPELFNHILGDFLAS